MMQPPLLTISDSHDSYPGRVSVFKFRHLGSSRFNEMAFLVHDGDGSFTHHGQVFFLRTTKGGFQWLGGRAPSHTRIFRGLACTSMIGMRSSTLCSTPQPHVDIGAESTSKLPSCLACIHIPFVWSMCIMFFVWYSSIIIITVCHIINWYKSFQSLLDLVCKGMARSWISSTDAVLGIRQCAASFWTVLRCIHTERLWAWWDSSANHWLCVEKNAETTITVRYKNPSFKNHHYLSQQIGFWCEFQNGIHACMAWHGMVLLYIEQYFAAQRWRSLGLQQSWHGMAGMVLLYSSTFLPS